MSLSFNEIKDLLNHAFCVISILFILYIYFLVRIHIPFYFITLARCLNNEHEDNQEMQLEFDFERKSCTDENDSEKYMDDETLPFEMRRLID